jgi:hypothetical protein
MLFEDYSIREGGHGAQEYQSIAMDTTAQTDQPI